MTATLSARPEAGLEPAAAAVYIGTVRHRRVEPGPRPREFTPKLFLSYLDVDALPGSLDAIPLWSARRIAPVHFRRRDFFDGGTKPLGLAVRDLVEERLGWRPSGSIFLLAHLRTFGALFNPLAVYYCWAPDNEGLDAVVLEVTNTPWGERHWYAFDARSGGAMAHAPKAMHVSPFLPMDVEYRVTWTVPGDDLSLRIAVERRGRRIFEADLALRRASLDRRTRDRIPGALPVDAASRFDVHLLPGAASVRAARSLVPSPCPPFARGRTMKRTTTVSAGVPVARVAVHRLLQHMKGGALEVTDPWGTERFGDGARDDGVNALRARATIHDPRVYARVLRNGSVGLGESYADGWWDTEDLTGVLRLAHRSLARTHPARDQAHRFARHVVDPIARLRRPDKGRDARNVRAHYDLGNELFQRLLDDTMMYSCGYFASPDDSLATASNAKLQRLARVLQLDRDDRVLEIGTGWGGFALYAARQFGCHVTTTTISERQSRYTRARVRAAGLDHLVTVREDDYRDVRGEFDKVIAIEMIEAVDWRDYDTFFACCRERLGDSGLLAMQAIVVPDGSFDRTKHHTDFIKAAIFPGGCLPSLEALTGAAQRSGLSLTHLDDIGLHYAETLRRWRANLARGRDELRSMGFDDRFTRLWDFYFSYCEAGFDERYISTVQVAFATPSWTPSPFAGRARNPFGARRLQTA